VTEKASLAAAAPTLYNRARMGALALALALIVAVVALILLLRAFVIVPPNQAYVVERLGRASRVLAPGIHILTPFVDRVSARVSTGSQSVETFTGPTPLASGGEASASGAVEFRVTNAMRAVTSVADYRDALDRLAATTWREAIGGSDHLTVIDKVRAAEASIRAAAEPWGRAPPVFVYHRRGRLSTTPTPGAVLPPARAPSREARRTRSSTRVRPRRSAAAARPGRHLARSP
jgi:hypothetical protein